MAPQVMCVARKSFDSIDSRRPPKSCSTSVILRGRANSSRERCDGSWPQTSMIRASARPWKHSS